MGGIAGSPNRGQGFLAYEHHGVSRDVGNRLKSRNVWVL